MASLVAIDPGFGRRSGGCACALFEGAELVRVWMARPSDRVDVACDVIVEKPQQDRRSRGVPPSTLIELAWQGAVLAGRIAGASHAVHALTPSEWKGSVPKPVHHARLWRCLTERERHVLGGVETWAHIDAARMRGAESRWGQPGASYYPARWTTHNMLDAVALGAHYLGRLL